MFDKKGYYKQYYKKNKEKIDKQNKQWREDNYEYLKEYCEKNNKIYSDRYKQKRNYRLRQRSKIDPKYNLNHRMGNAIQKALKGNKNGRKWEILVGYTLDNLIKRLKQTIPEGYTWRDYLEGKLHIDHKIPISVFNYTKPEHIDFKRCWALDNLQLLPAKENIIKDVKLERPFQPALQLC